MVFSPQPRSAFSLRDSYNYRFNVCRIIAGFRQDAVLPPFVVSVCIQTSTNIRLHMCESCSLPTLGMCCDRLSEQMYRGWFGQAFSHKTCLRGGFGMGDRFSLYHPHAQGKPSTSRTYPARNILPATAGYTRRRKWPCPANVATPATTLRFSEGRYRGSRFALRI